MSLWIIGFDGGCWSRRGSRGEQYYSYPMFQTRSKIITTQRAWTSWHFPIPTANHIKFVVEIDSTVILVRIEYWAVMWSMIFLAPRNQEVIYICLP
jgi:hypothetical protein